MAKKSELLKELGWNDELIRHFMVDDSYFIEKQDSTVNLKSFETNFITVTYESWNSESVLNYES